LQWRRKQKDQKILEIKQKEKEERERGTAQMMARVQVPEDE
jgi:hypothetical protein